jgi:hypothetical protein
MSRQSHYFHVNKIQDFLGPFRGFCGSFPAHAGLLSLLLMIFRYVTFVSNYNLYHEMGKKTGTVHVLDVTLIPFIWLCRFAS